MAKQIEELAAFVATTQWEDVPEPVQRHTKLVLLDTLGVILAGAERPEVRQLRERLAASAGSGATVYARGWPSCDPRTAALLNGIAGRSIELCEGLRLVSGQAAMQVLPGVLAVGEQARSSGREMLTALLLGYDVAARLAGGVHAAAAGASERPGVAARGGRGGRAPARSRRARDQPRDAHRHDAAADAELHQRGGRRDGAQRRRRHERLRRRAGARTGARRLRGAGRRDRGGARPAGRRRLHADGLLDELGTTWQITRNYFRLYACCNPIHPALDCLQRRWPSCSPRPDEIARIDFATYRFASVMRNPDPPNYFASKYSLPHAAATMVVRGHAGFAALDDTAVHDPVIAALRHRVTVTEDPAMTRRGAAAASGARDRDADRRPQRHAPGESHRGDFRRPVRRGGTARKVPRACRGTLTLEGAALVEQAVDRCEEWDNIDALTALCRRHGRP